MRLFVAIDVSDDTRAQLTRVRTALQQRLEAVRKQPRVTWVAEQAAHVTLRFIGEVSEETADKVRSVLAAPFDRGAYEIEFGGAGVFPNSRRARTIWIGARRGQEETAALAAAVNARLNAIIGAGEARDFRAHLTVGRVKEPAPFDWAAAFAAIEPGRTLSRIDHITLYQSKPSPKGPTYTSLLRTPLG